MKESRFKVIIVGGGIGGLALANSLQHTGIDYVLVEKAKSLDPQVGASIGILPNGARILDQIGCFDELAALTVDMESTASHAADGSLIGQVSDTLSLMRRRTGYPVIFIDRQLLLRALSRHILEPDRILLEKSVQSVEQYDDKAVVHCTDGTLMEADVVVGADGVHSIVRREMWRHADANGEGESFLEDTKAMSAEYKCLFGISTSISGMEPGQTDRTYAHGLSTLSYIGKEGRIFWFVFIKMDQVYHPPHIPKFTSDDVAAVIKEHGGLALRDRGKVSISDLYDRLVCCNLVAIEEAKYQQWSYGRLICLGDSIHKMTPNLGAGASSAIESAAVLSNVIVRLASSSSKPSLSDIRLAAEQYQDSRTLRVGRAMEATNKLTRVQALQTKKDYIFAHYIAPWIDDVYAEAFSSFVIGAPVVDHLPIPERSLQGTMPFNPKQGWGYEEPVSARIRRALPLIVLSLLFTQRSSQLPDWLPHIVPSGLHHYFAAHTGLSSKLVKRRDLALAVHADITYGIWLLEATRLSNKASLVQIPLLFGLGWRSLEFPAVVPLYFCLLYVQSSIQKFRASDIRLTDISYTYSVGPLILLLCVLPRYLPHSGFFMDNIYTGVNQSSSTHVGSSYWSTTTPVLLLLLLSTLQFFVARFLRPSTIRSDRIWAVGRDVTIIRCTTGAFVALSVLPWITYLDEWRAILGRHVNASRPVHLALFDLLGRDGILLTLSSAMWLGLTFRDLRVAGMMDATWVKIILLGFVSCITLGPGVMFVLGWQWREEMLVHRRHRDAVVAQ